MESSYLPILHIEDDENDILLVKRALCSAGIAHPVQVIKNGERALDYLAGNSPYEKRQFYPLPCLIIMDLGLPLVNGFEVLRWRQTQPKIRRIPLLVLTSSQEPVSVIAAYEAGANSYLLKPVGFDELVDLMKSIQAFWLTNNVFAPSSSMTAPTPAPAATNPNDHLFNSVLPVH